MSRPIGALLKEHAVLVAGIALPVLLIILFSVARAIPAKTVADPIYQAVFAVNPYYSGFTFETKANKIIATYTKPKDNYAPSNPEKPRILIYDGATDKATTITLDAPTAAKDQTSVAVPVKEVADLQISSEPESPDGYMFQREGYRGSSLITEIFTYNSRHSPHALIKDGRIIPVTPLKNTYDVTFLGWVTK